MMSRASAGGDDALIAIEDALLPAGSWCWQLLHATLVAVAARWLLLLLAWQRN
jgi:hypothetical protein